MTDRPVPHPSPLTEPFWAGCREGRLLVQRCDECATYVFIPQEFCRRCHATTLRWVESVGVGRVVTYTVVWRPQTPAFEVPYVVAVVRLDEGYEMVTNIVGAPPDAVAVDAPVRVRFTPVTEEITLPSFELAA